MKKHPLMWLALMSCVFFGSSFTGHAEESASIDLLGEGLAQWTLDREGAWVLNEEGLLTPSETPGGYVWSRDRFADFELSLEYKTSETCNSGLFFRTDPTNPVQGGFEIQIASPDIYDGKHVVGSLYDAKEPSSMAAKPNGEWNVMTLRCEGPNLSVDLNGQRVLEANLDDWATPNENPDGTKNKFKTALKDLPREGHLGLQYHGHPVWFRKVQITKL
ncbi:MAG: DUF1080 domain-containing protein [Verrucomicrobiota bacterium]